MKEQLRVPRKEQFTQEILDFFCAMDQDGKGPVLNLPDFTQRVLKLFVAQVISMGYQTNNSFIYFFLVGKLTASGVINK